MKKWKQRVFDTLLIVGLLLIILGCVFSTAAVRKAHGAHKKTEKEYQVTACQWIDGEPEFVLPDNTRVDCLSNTFAMEVDFGPKWAEAIGQALYYSAMTGKRPMIWLIIEEEEWFKYNDRIKTTIQYHNLDITVIPHFNYCVIP